MKRKILGVGAAIVLSIFMLGCNDGSDIADQVANVIQAEDENVLFVKEGISEAYPDITYGEAFESFFASPTWKYFNGTQEGPDEDGDGKSDYVIENIDVVEFTGYCVYQEVEVKALIQFTLDKENGTFDVSYLSFNDIPQNNLILLALLEAVFTDGE